MPRTLFRLALACLLPFLFAPTLAFAQAAADNTMPAGGVYEDTGRFRQTITATIQVGKDSVTGRACFLGFSATCTVGGGTAAGATETTLAAVLAELQTPAASLPPASPTADTTLGITSTETGSALACLVVKAGAGNLYSLSGNVNVADTWIMVFNATAAPGDGAVTPKFAYKFPAGPWSVDFGSLPRAFSTGITVCASSTGPFTKTAYATNNFIAGSAK